MNIVIGIFAIIGVVATIIALFVAHSVWEEEKAKARQRRIRLRGAVENLLSKEDGYIWLDTKESIKEEFVKFLESR